MTDLFFALYRQGGYFKIEEYNPKRYKGFVFSQTERYGKSFFERHFNETYSSLVYGFNENNKRIK